jgi:hypothetical protein
MAFKRLNFTLPDDVVRLLEKKARAGEKSMFVAEAIREYATKDSRKRLMEELIESYSERAKDNPKDANEWDSTLSDGLEDEN